MRPIERDCFRAWVVFILILTIATTFFRLFLWLVIVPAAGGRTSTRFDTLFGAIEWLVTIAISYAAFRYVVRRLLTRRTTQQDATRTI
jgi:hypothetical protein